jgi:hypothetical protein
MTAKQKSAILAILFFLLMVLPVAVVLIKENTARAKK